MLISALNNQQMTEVLNCTALLIYENCTQKNGRPGKGNVRLVFFKRNFRKKKKELFQDTAWLQKAHHYSVLRRLI